MRMLKIEDMHVYYGAIHAIKGISFEVGQGEIVASSAQTVQANLPS